MHGLSANIENVRLAGSENPTERLGLSKVSRAEYKSDPGAIVSHCCGEGVYEIKD